MIHQPQRSNLLVIRLPTEHMLRTAVIRCAILLDEAGPQLPTMTLYSARLPSIVADAQDREHGQATQPYLAAPKSP